MSIDNRIEINDCEDDGVDFSTTGGALGTNTATGNLIEGAASVQFLHSNVYDDTTTVDDSGGTLLDIDMTDATYYILVKANGWSTFSVAAQMLVLGDGVDRIGYATGGSDAVGVPLQKQFYALKLDGSDAIANPGAADVGHHVFAGAEGDLNFASIVEIGYGSLHSAKAQGNVANTWIDAMCYLANGSYALTINGGTIGTPETTSDVVLDDEGGLLTGLGFGGLITNPQGSLFYFVGPTEWGDDAATADTYFEAIDEQWFWVGDNQGGRAVGATHFPYRVVGNATDTISFELTRVVIVNTGTRAQLDLSNADVDILNLSGVTFDQLDTITFPANSATKDMDSLIFNNCGQVYFDTVDVLGAIFNGTTDPLGALLWDVSSDEEAQDGLTFNSDGTGHAIYITVNTASETIFNITGYSVNDYETASGGSTGNTVFLVDNQADGLVTINVTGGSGTFSYELTSGTASQVDVIATVAVTVDGMTQGSAVVLQARETVGSVTEGDTIFQGFAQADGGIDYSHNNEGDLDINVRANNPGHCVAAISADTGGTVFTDETEASTDDTDSDVNLLPASPASDDAFYFGHTEQFFALKLWITDANGTGSTLTWEYWNGAWVALGSVVDGTNNYENSGHGLVVSWADPGDWATTTVTNQANTGQLFYVRARLTTVGSANQSRARRVTIDATRYLPFPQEGNAIRTITGTGLAVTAVWLEDTIGTF